MLLPSVCGAPLVGVALNTSSTTLASNGTLPTRSYGDCCLECSKRSGECKGFSFFPSAGGSADCVLVSVGQGAPETAAAGALSGFMQAV